MRRGRQRGACLGRYVADFSGCRADCPRRLGWRRSKLTRSLDNAAPPAGLHERSPLIMKACLRMDLRVVELFRERERMEEQIMVLQEALAALVEYPFKTWSACNRNLMMCGLAVCATRYFIGWGGVLIAHKNQNIPYFKFL